jgi:hypothetical protein
MRRLTTFASMIWIAAALGGCHREGKPAETAPSPSIPEPAADVTSSAPPAAHAGVPGDLLSQLDGSKLTLTQGIQQAEKENGPATSAKFELHDGHLSLSVYTAKNGLDADAEHNVLMELSGDPTREKWEPKAEIFEDKAHITRAAMHLTLLQRAKVTLASVLAKAAARHPGKAYSVTPVVKDKRPAFEVLIASPDGKSISAIIPVD